MTSDLLVTVAAVRGHRFIWTFTAATRVEALRSLGRYASDPDLDFTWYDAAKIARDMRNARTMECSR